MVSSLQGRVVEFYTAQPIPDATVRLNGHLTTTNQRGTFRFTRVPSRRYTITVLHRDFERKTVPVDLTKPESYRLGEPIKMKSEVRPLG